MDAQEFLHRIAGIYVVKQFGRVIEGDSEMSLYFPPVGMMRRLYPALIDGQWVGKFVVTMPQGDEAAPLAAKIARANYHFLPPDRLRCNRIPIVGNSWIDDEITVRLIGGSGPRRELVHRVQLFEGDQLKGVGEWICPET